MRIKSQDLTIQNMQLAISELMFQPNEKQVGVLYISEDLHFIAVEILVGSNFWKIIELPHLPCASWFITNQETIVCIPEK